MGNVADAMKKEGQWIGENNATDGANTTPIVVAPAKPRAKGEVISPDKARYSNALVAWHERGGKISEQYRALRTHLLAQYKDKPFALVVTSALGGEGKTVTCLNLAFTLGMAVDRRTIVVDCDFRRQGSRSMLSGHTGPGLADVLRGEAAISDAIKPTTMSNVSVIHPGSTSADEVGGLVSRVEMEELVCQLRKDYDYVLFDTPPINILSDASSVGRLAGDALLVVRMNRTRRESVHEAIRRLSAVDVRLMGMVLTHQRYYIPNYLYRYC